MSESLLGNISATVAIIQNVWAPFPHKQAQHDFWEFTFNFDARCASRKFTTYSCLHVCQR